MVMDPNHKGRMKDALPKTLEEASDRAQDKKPKPEGSGDGRTLRLFSAKRDDLRAMRKLSRVPTSRIQGCSGTIQPVHTALQSTCLIRHRSNHAAGRGVRPRPQIAPRPPRLILILRSPDTQIKRSETPRRVQGRPGERNA